MLYATIVTFKFMCFMLATYLTFRQVVRYLENNDAPVIQYKSFNETPDDKYPTFTFCIAGDPKIAYKDGIGELAITKEEYSELLKGRNISNDVSGEKFNRIVGINPERFAIKPQNMISKIRYETSNRSDFVYYKKNHKKYNRVETLERMLYPNHQDPYRTCFTRNLKLENHRISMRRSDEIQIYWPYFINVDSGDRTNSKGKFEFYIHYPLHFTRIIRDPIYEMAFKDISNHAIDVSFSIPHVSILKKRHDAVKKCDNSLKDNDNRFRMKVSEKVGCIPIYWRHILNLNVSLPICNDSIHLNQIYNLIRFSKNFLLTYDPPCVELTPLVLIFYSLL